MSAGEPGLLARLSRLGGGVAEADWFRFARSGITVYSARRCFGMSAEAAFWAMFTLPFLVLGVLAATAGVARFFDEDVTQQVRKTIIDAAGRVLTPSAVDDFLVPLVDGVLAGSGGLSLVGFLAALWSGSRIFVTFAEGSVAIYGHPARGYVRTRGLSLLAYVVGLAALAVVALSAVLFPDAWSAVMGFAPGGRRVWVLVGVVVFLVVAATTMMFIVNPRRRDWRDQLPGGLLAVLAWLVGSWGLQLYFAWLFRSGSVYGAIASIIAVLVWALVTTTAVFAGMTLNATLRLARQGVYLTPRLVGVADEAALAAEDTVAQSGRQRDPLSGRGATGEEAADEAHQAGR